MNKTTKYIMLRKGEITVTSREVSPEKLPTGSIFGYSGCFHVIKKIGDNKYKVIDSNVTPCLNKVLKIKNNYFILRRFGLYMPGIGQVCLTLDEINCSCYALSKSTLKKYEE